jgi:SAM-dependent methyltransferase
MRENVAGATLIEADIEQAAWPLMDAGLPRRFDAVVVTNYLWRPLMGILRSSLAPGGVLLYETFACGNETVGRPARPDFLLRDGELLEICTGLQVVAYENGFLQEPDRFVQRIAAINVSSDGEALAPLERYAL